MASSSRRQPGKPNRKIDVDVSKLMKHYDVELVHDDSLREFYVKFQGPIGGPYEGGIWKIHVLISEEYPSKAPKIKFVNKIYHPNIGIRGNVCVNVMNEGWRQSNEVTHIFDYFIPELLKNPNPDDPLNGGAATLLLADKAAYEQRVKEHCQKYATGKAIEDAISLIDEDRNHDIEINWREIDWWDVLSDLRVLLIPLFYGILVFTTDYFFPR